MSTYILFKLMFVLDAYINIPTYMVSQIDTKIDFLHRMCFLLYCKFQKFHLHS